MKILLIDDKCTEPLFRNLKDYVRQYDIEIELRPPPATGGTVIAMYNEVGPDAVLLDAAFSEREETLLTGLMAGSEIDYEQIGGLRLCLEIKGAFPDCPVGLFTEYLSGPLAQAALDIGVDHCIQKSPLPASLSMPIRNLLNASICDAPLYYRLKRSINNGSDTFWQAKYTSEALDIFYKRKSPTRRFRLLCDHLSVLLLEVFSTAMEMAADLVDRLGKSQTILALSGSHIWDHVCHSGNVFWIGYYLLNTISQYRDPATLEGFKSSVFTERNELSLFDQFNLSWMIASLFHDIGYADEKHGDLLHVAATVSPGSVLATKNALDATVVKTAIAPLVELLEKALGRDDPVCKAFEFMRTFYGDEVQGRGVGKKDERVTDHGILSAAQLMKWKSESRVPIAMERVIEHAAVAMALHNLVKWQETYRDVPGDCQLKLGSLPICNLLAFCDTLQSWDRELVSDYSRQDERPELAERIRRAKRAYVQGSRIATFDVSGETDAGNACQLSARIRYYMSPGISALDEARQHLAKLKRWRTEQWADRLRTAFSLNHFLGARIEYYVPVVDDSVRVDI